MNNNIQELLQKKSKKIKKRIQEKVPYQWSENQLNTMVLIQYNAPRLRIEGTEIYRDSILNKNNLINNKDFIKQFFQYYYNYNIPQLMKTFHYLYLDFSNANNLVDAYQEDVSFTGFNFSKESLKNSIENNKSLLPFYAYKHKIKNKYAICGGRHRFQILKNQPNSYLYLCLLWDDMPNNIESDLIVPIVVEETVLSSLNLFKEQIDKDFIKLYFNNPVDFWLTVKAIDKELSYIIDYNFDLLKELNIQPPQDILYKIKEV